MKKKKAFEIITSKINGHVYIGILNNFLIPSIENCFGDANGLVSFVGFYGISTFVGYLTPNLFLCK